MGRYRVENWLAQAQAHPQLTASEQLEELQREEQALLYQLDCTVAMLDDMMGTLTRYYWRERPAHPHVPDRLAVGVLQLPGEDPEYLTEDEWMTQVSAIHHQQAQYRADIQWPLRVRLRQVREELRACQPVWTRPRKAGHFARACEAHQALR